MRATVSLTVRVPPGLPGRLKAEARRRRMTLVALVVEKLDAVAVSVDKQ